MATEFVLPLFHLGLVLYPDERLPLHIFEPRYKAMIGRCLEEDTPFGVILVKDGISAQVGCMARIRQVINRYEDGRLDILVQGDHRFQVKTIHQDEAYTTATVQALEEPRLPVQQDLRERLITQHIKLVELAERTPQPTRYQTVKSISYFIAHNAGLTLAQKQTLLEMPSENERILYLVNHLEALIPQVEQVEALRRKVRSNGHLRDFPPQQSSEE